MPNQPILDHLLPHHLRPEVQEHKRRDHPTLCAPQSEDFDNEFYGFEGRGGLRIYTGNKHS